MSEFWIIFIAYGVLFIPVVFFFVSCGATKEVKKWGAIVGIILWGFVALMCNLNVVNNRTIWNNGYCECGAHWELTAASKYRGTETKYYTCPDCFNEIELSY